MEKDCLQHHGRKGQKWGQRLYQNKDGSLTALGRIRYGENPNGTSKTASKKSNTKSKKAKETNEKKPETPKEREARREKTLKSTNAKEIYENRDLLTTNEINERIIRINTEQKLGAMAKTPTKTEKAMDYVDKAIKVGKKMNEVYEFTNTPIMKEVKKQLGLEKESRPVARSLEDVYNNRNSLRTNELTDSLRRANTERAIRNILEEQR